MQLTYMHSNMKPHFEDDKETACRLGLSGKETAYESTSELTLYEIGISSLPGFRWKTSAFSFSY